jgi:hypothetical protein
MDMETPPTCGKGLAAHAALPAKLGELSASLARNLEIHMKALDLEDENSRREHEAYRELAKEHREIATQLQATAKQMAGYRNLPMGRHDQQAMSASEVLEAFETFVQLEQDLLTLLQNRVEQDRQMLIEMRGAGTKKAPRQPKQEARTAASS